MSIFMQQEVHVDDPVFSVVHEQPMIESLNSGQIIIEDSYGSLGEGPECDEHRSEPRSDIDENINPLDFLIMLPNIELVVLPPIVPNGLVQDPKCCPGKACVTVKSISLFQANYMGAPTYTTVHFEYLSGQLEQKTKLGSTLFSLVNDYMSALAQIDRNAVNALPRASLGAAHLHNTISLFYALRSIANGERVVNVFLHKYPRTIMPNLNSSQFELRLEAAFQQMRRILEDDNITGLVEAGKGVQWWKVASIFRDMFVMTVKRALENGNRGTWNINIYIIDPRVFLIEQSQ